MPVLPPRGRGVEAGSLASRGPGRGWVGEGRGRGLGDDPGGNDVGAAILRNNCVLIIQIVVWPHSRSLPGHDLSRQPGMELGVRLLITVYLNYLFSFIAGLNSNTKQ